MNERNVHVDTHPSGHPNKTAVNAENPIFGRPVDPIPEVSFQQAAVVQSEKTPRDTVQSPLLSGVDESPVPISDEPVVENTETLPEQSAEEVAAVQQAEQEAADDDDFDDDIEDEEDDDEAQDSSPSAEDLDAVASETEAKEATSGTEDDDEEERPQDSETANAPADPIPAS